MPRKRENAKQAVCAAKVRLPRQKSRLASLEQLKWLRRLDASQAAAANPWLSPVKQHRAAGISLDVRQGRCRKTSCDQDRRVMKGALEPWGKRRTCGRSDAGLPSETRVACASARPRVCCKLPLECAGARGCRGGQAAWAPTVAAPLGPRDMRRVRLRSCRRSCWDEQRMSLRCGERSRLHVNGGMRLRSGQHAPRCSRA